jgi:hypothetical protein
MHICTIHTKYVTKKKLGTDHLTTTQELEYLFFCCAKHKFFFQNLTLGYMTKTLNQIIFFSSTKIRIFFSATLGIRIFFRKKPYLITSCQYPYSVHYSNVNS